MNDMVSMSDIGSLRAKVQAKRRSGCKISPSRSDSYVFDDEEVSGRSDVHFPGDMDDTETGGMNNASYWNTRSGDEHFQNGAEEE
jgi:hypothetical protein